MVNFTPKLKRLLMDAGWVYLRSGKGDHEIWVHPPTGRKITLDLGTKSRHTANEALKKAALPKAF